MDPFNIYTVYVLPGVALVILFCIIGVFGNLNILWATFRKRQLRSSCNIFIAFNAFADVLHQSGHFLFAFFYFSGNAFDTAENVFYTYIPTLFGSTLGLSVMLAIAFDRLFCIVYPIRYNNPDPTYIFTLQINCGWPIHIGIASSYFAYFALSKEYRAAFLEQLSFLTCKRIPRSKTNSSLVKPATISSNTL
ncbi:unnamed protein product [Bursaphelenchus xylophilus]|uniref:(pine wood nematode) hypothetical protein n=1 Tax=Bursaphelenchus xylophilus TaxID=6326 RepID=A0A1I7RZW1_BURXY|nr:unnamed protein product [Bursaphelenchus xylophilus]CAG9109190.1 unnamed protein product [Bursaphelenchus xylophilus]